MSINDEILCLAKKLPFPTLLWQLFGPLIINISVTQNNALLRDSGYDALSVEALHNPQVQAILVDSLQSEGLSTYPTHCNHLLHYLWSLITAIRDKDSVTLNVTSGDLRENSGTANESDIKTAMALVLQLLELMFDGLGNAKDLSRSSPEEELVSNEVRCVTRCDSVMRDFCKAFLGHPVLYECFVSKLNKQGKDVQKICL